MFEIGVLPKTLVDLLDDFNSRIKKLERRVEELEKNPKIINNYHNTYPQPNWVPTYPPVYKYDVTCGSNANGTGGKPL